MDKKYKIIIIICLILSIISASSSASNFIIMYSNNFPAEQILLKYGFKRTLSMDLKSKTYYNYIYETKVILFDNGSFLLEMPAANKAGNGKLWGNLLENVITDIYDNELAFQIRWDWAIGNDGCCFGPLNKNANIFYSADLTKFYVAIDIFPNRVISPIQYFQYYYK